MRLAKYLAHCGVASRRRAEELIAQRRVRVGGETVTDPARDVDESSAVEVDGRPIVPEPREVWIVNKPAGVVSTAREPGRRPAVVELVDSERRLYPVGRLDADSTGLILLTNDGELANRLTHPRYGIERTLPGQAAPPHDAVPAPAAAKRRRAGGRAHGAGPAARSLSAGGRVDAHRGAQPAGAADGRGRRKSGRCA